MTFRGLSAVLGSKSTVHVTSGSAAAQCKATSLFDSGVIVHCFAPTGAPVVAYYSVMLGS